MKLDDTDYTLAIILAHNDPHFVKDGLIPYIERNLHEYKSIQYPEKVIAFNDFVHNSLRSIFWQTLVLKFGSYVVSPRFGWVIKQKKCLKYLKLMQKEIEYELKTMPSDAYQELAKEINPLMV